MYRHTWKINGWLIYVASAGYRLGVIPTPDEEGREHATVSATPILLDFQRHEVLPGDRELERRKVYCSGFIVTSCRDLISLSEICATSRSDENSPKLSVSKEPIYTWMRTGLSHSMTRDLSFHLSSVLLHPASDIFCGTPPLMPSDN